MANSACVGKRLRWCFLSPATALWKATTKRELVSSTFEAVSPLGA